MLIIGINGSPRLHGNSRKALETALKAAEAKGAETKMVDINAIEFSPCHACDYCKNHHGICTQDDEFNEIIKLLRQNKEAYFILASPIYFAQLSSQMKKFVDRLYAFYQTDFIEKYGEIKASIIISQGMNDPEIFKPYLESTINTLKFAIGIDVVDIVVLTDNNIPGAFNDKPDQIEEATKLGENLVG